jgi:hypothetical protein
MSDFPIRIFNTGEQWGALEYHRLMDDDKAGVIVWVGSSVTGEGVEIRVSPAGRKVQMVRRTMPMDFLRASSGAPQ